VIPNPMQNDHPDVWALYQPLMGSSMLELGNKKTTRAGVTVTYKAYFESIGYRHVSVDWNGEDGSMKRDLRRPLNLGTFDMVTNIGTSEHVQNNQAAVWRNMCEALHVGAALICTTPNPGDWTWHGWHHPQLEFYEQLAQMNGLTVERLFICGLGERRMVFCRAIRSEVVPFVMPSSALIHYNEGGQR